MEIDQANNNQVYIGREKIADLAKNLSALSLSENTLPLKQLELVRFEG